MAIANAVGLHRLRRRHGVEARALHELRRVHRATGGTAGVAVARASGQVLVAHAPVEKHLEASMNLVAG